MEQISKGELYGIDCWYGRSTVSGIRVVLLKTPSPVLEMFLMVATEAVSDEGEPHCLEHLIFRGSEKYPVPGVLDSLAMTCLGTGTNAYTMQDRTVYTVTVTGEEGMNRIFPVYLDHVLNPLLHEEQFQMECYHVDTEGRDCGVAYCEMEYSMNQPGNISEMHLLRSAYGPANLSYWNSGGHPDAMRNLSIERVRKCHERFYRPELLTLLISGCTSLENVKRLIRETEESMNLRGFSGPVIQSPSFVSLPHFRGKTTIDFYADDEDGQVMVTMGWRPEIHWSDRETTVGMEMLLEYFTDGPAGRISEELIENPETAIASDVSFAIHRTTYPLYFLKFYGCTQANRLISGRVTEIMKSDKIDMKRMKNLLTKWKLEELNLLEERESLDDRVFDWILYGDQVDLRNHVINDQVLDVLLTKPQSYWADLLKTHLVEGEIYENIMYPTTVNLSNIIRSRLASHRAGKFPKPGCNLDPDEQAKIRRNIVRDHGDHAKPEKGIVDTYCTPTYTNSRAESSLIMNAHLQKFKVPAHLVDMKLDTAAKFHSNFVELSLIAKLPEEFTKKSIAEFAEFTGYEGLKAEHAEFIKDLLKTDLENLWRLKQNRLKEQEEDLTEESAYSTEEDDSEPDVSSDSDKWETDEDDDADFNLFIQTGVKLVLQKLTPSQIVYLVTDIYFDDNLILPKGDNEAAALFDGAQDCVLKAKDLTIYLDRIALEYDVSMGVGQNVDFHDHVHVNWKTSLDLWEASLGYLKAGLVYAAIDSDRLRVQIKKTMTEDLEKYRSQTPVVRSLIALMTYKWSSVPNIPNFLVSLLMCKVILSHFEMFSSIIKSILKYPGFVKSIMESSIVQVSADMDQFIQRNGFDHLKKTFPGLYKQQSEPSNLINPPKTITMKMQENSSSKFVAHGLTTPHADSAQMIIQCQAPKSMVEKYGDNHDIYVGNEALTVVNQFLGALDGPIFQPVRDSGAAYGARYGIKYSPLLQIAVINVSTNPRLGLELLIDSTTKVLATVKELLDLDRQNHESCPPTIEQFEQARSGALSEAITQLETPGSTSAVLFDAWIHNLPDDTHLKLIERVRKSFP